MSRIMFLSLGDVMIAGCMIADFEFDVCPCTVRFVKDQDLVNAVK